MYSSLSNSSPVKALTAPLALPFSPFPEFAKKRIRRNETLRTERWGFMGLIRIHCVLNWGFCESWGLIRIHPRKQMLQP